MLHPVEIPDCLNALWKVVEIQEKLLELALDSDPVNRDHLTKVFNKATVDWLWKYQDELLRSLSFYFNHTSAEEKASILNAFRHDISYHEYLNDPGFTFRLLPKDNLPSNLSEPVGKFLKKFYDVITNVNKGFPKEISGFSCDINGQVICSSILSKNPTLHVCPACDGTWMERTSTGVLGSIDHFLPRSKYPALSVHPMNLLPICPTCNEKIKRDKDPLSEIHPRTLPETFHSYIRPARAQISINIGTEWAITSKGSYTHNQLLIFQDILDLPGRWQQDEDELCMKIRRRIRDNVNAYVDAGHPKNQATFERILAKIDKELHDQWGEDGNLYPATWYYRWLCQNKKAELLQEYTR